MRVGGVVVSFHVSPVLATLLLQFSEHKQLTAAQLAEAVRRSVWVPDYLHSRLWGSRRVSQHVCLAGKRVHAVVQLAETGSGRGGD